MRLFRDHEKYLPTTRDIARVFREEVESLGGSVIEFSDDRARLYARALLDPTGDVRPGDRVRAGVALRALGPEVEIHPYTHRIVCENGAISTRAFESRRIERLDVAASTAAAVAYDNAVTLASIGDAVRACAAPEAFRETVDGMQRASETAVDDLVRLASALRRLFPEEHEEILSRILRTFFEHADPDGSVFGLLNAVTSTGRDERDPETRWRLEELGGDVPALLLPVVRVAPYGEAALMA